MKVLDGKQRLDNHILAIREVLAEHLSSEGTLRGLGNHVFFISLLPNNVEEIISSSEVSLSDNITKFTKKFAFEISNLKKNNPIGFCFLFESAVQVKSRDTGSLRVFPHTVCISTQTLDGQSRFDMLVEEQRKLLPVPEEVMPEVLNGKWVKMPTDEEMKEMEKNKLPAYQDKFLSSVVSEYLFYRLFSTLKMSEK